MCTLAPNHSQIENLRTDMAKIMLLNFPVQVSSPELIRPEKQTPNEILYLSNIDDQSGLRNHIPFVHFYPQRTGTSMQGDKDLVVLIKQALSKVLVYYYPVAGRLRNGDNGKLVVECNGEGVMFREANAAVKLAELHELAEGGLRPPFPEWGKLLVDDIWGSNFITDSPLLRLQVTRLACGGFVLAYTFNHCICDAYGAYQFMQALSEFFRDPSKASPSSLPSWGREILKPRSPPTISYAHPEYDTARKPADTFTETQYKHLAQTSVFLSRTDISLLKNQFPNNKVPTFDVVAACLWRARTRTLLSPDCTTRLVFPIDTRFRYKPSLPKGYYGSAVVFPCAIMHAAKLVEKPLPYAASLISAVKKGVSGDEYRASVLDFIEANGRRGFCSEGAFVVSDMTRLGFADIDFGYGKALYGGPARAGTGVVPGMVTSLITHKNKEGIDGVLGLVSLPPESLEKFHNEIRKQVDSIVPSKFISAL